MDSVEPSTRSKSRILLVLLRFFFALVFSFFGVLSLVIVVVVLAMPSGNLSISPPISVPSQCKIVSSSVDLRSSKVCELGLLNFKAKRVFYPSEKRKFRCHYDYYWASVFKVNESYNCWYTAGLSNVDIYQDNYFGCQVKEPSSIEMIRRSFILSARMFYAWLSSQDIANGMGLGMIAGAASGFLTSIISVGLFKMLQPMIVWLTRTGGAKMISVARQMLLSRVFFLLAYFSIVGWLAIQYGKKLGIPVAFVDY
ncbi:hypothetical protein Ancab_033089 [Ancistrocladus abbreviatus]